MNKRGFTVVEVVVSIVLAGILIIGLFTSVSSIIAVNERSTQHTTASNLAYSNLRLYADGNTPLWFSCNTSNQTAPFTVLDKSEQVNGLPGTVHETVTAAAPYGCDGTSSGYPIAVTSTVSLPTGMEVSHATYTAF